MGFCNYILQMYSILVQKQKSHPKERVALMKIIPQIIYFAITIKFDLRLAK